MCPWVGLGRPCFSQAKGGSPKRHGRKTEGELQLRRKKEDEQRRRKDQQIWAARFMSEKLTKLGRAKAGGANNSGGLR